MSQCALRVRFLVPPENSLFASPSITSSACRKANWCEIETARETLHTEENFATPHLTVVTDKVRTPTQPAGREWAIVQRKPAVVIAPLTHEGKFVLILEERIPIRATIWSMPAGQIDGSRDPDEATIRAVAARELREETGYELEPGAELIPLGHYFTSPGLTDEHCYFFLARPVLQMCRRRRARRNRGDSSIAASWR